MAFTRTRPGEDLNSRARSKKHNLLLLRFPGDSEREREKERDGGESVMLEKLYTLYTHTVTTLSRRISFLIINAIQHYICTYSVYDPSCTVH